MKSWIIYEKATWHPIAEVYDEEPLQYLNSDYGYMTVLEWLQKLNNRIKTMQENNRHTAQRIINLK